MTLKNILFFGCSYTDTSNGFVDADKMYPALLCKYFNLKEKNYAINGVGNYKSFDIISDLNFGEESLVVLQLTELARIRRYDTVLRDIILSNTNDRCLISVYTDNFLLHELKRHLKLVVSLCRAKNVKIVIWSIARSFDEEFCNKIESFLNSFPEYIYLDNSLESKDSYRVDNGRDGTDELGTGHPGPKSHAIIAQKLIDKINELYPNLVDK